MLLIFKVIIRIEKNHFIYNRTTGDIRKFSNTVSNKVEYNNGLFIMEAQSLEVVSVTEKSFRILDLTELEDFALQGIYLFQAIFYVIENYILCLGSITISKIEFFPSDDLKFTVVTSDKEYIFFLSFKFQ